MTRYTYKVIPAPAKGRKSPGVKGAEARFAHGLEEVMNEMAAQGWEYLRADILPSEERQGLTSSTTVYRSVLVFRREAKGTGSAERPVPSLTARRGPPPEEELTLTRKAPDAAAATASAATSPVSGDVTQTEPPETATEANPAKDDIPARPEEEHDETETPIAEEPQDKTDDSTDEEENDPLRR